MWDLLDIAWKITSDRAPDDGHPRNLYHLAVGLVKAAEQAADPSEDSRLACLHYLGSAYAKAGDLPGAARAEQKAIGIMERSKKDYSAELKGARKQLVVYGAGQVD